MRRVPQKMAIHGQMIFDAILLLFLVATHGQMIIDAILLLLLIGLYLYSLTLSSTRNQVEGVLISAPTCPAKRAAVREGASVTARRAPKAFASVRQDARNLYHKEQKCRGHINKAQA